MKPIKVLYCGTPKLAVPTLEALHQDPGYEVVGVVTPPAKPAGRKNVLKKCAVQVAAEAMGLDHYTVGHKGELEPVYAATKPDVALVIALGVIFPAEVLEMPPHKTLNVHFSLLPLLRGASPVQTAILEGHEVSGITLQVMAPKLDTGPVVWQHVQEMTDEDTTVKLWEAWGQMTAEQMPDVLRGYIEGKYMPVEQEDGKATYCGMFTREDGIVDPDTMTAEDIERRFRALNPWPGIAVETQVGRVKLNAVSLEEGEGSTPLLCAEGTTLYVGELTVPGKKKMRGEEAQEIYGGRLFGEGEY